MWPTIIASTVVSVQGLGDVDDRARPRACPAVLPTVFVPAAVPSWMTTICTWTPRARRRSDSAVMRSASSRKVRPAVAPAETSSGVVSRPAPMTPTLTPLTLKTTEGRDPRRAPCRSPSRRCSWRGTGSSPEPGAPAAGRPRSRTRGCRRTSRRGPRRSRHRWPACPRAGPSSAARRRRCRRRRAAARASAGPRTPRRTSSRGRRRRRPWHVQAVACDIVVGSSWPWKSLRPTIETGPDGVAALDHLEQHRDPGCAAARGTPSM